LLPPWHPHYDVWLLVFLLAYGYWYADRRLRPVIAPDQPGATTGQKWQWYLAVFFLWFVSGWPVHDLGETALFTVHMVEHMVIALVIPPLLLRGTVETGPGLRAVQRHLHRHPLARSRRVDADR
jgi:cytochrome c oxidase assembly factor CtaG